MAQSRPTAPARVVTRRALIQLRRRWRRQGLRVAFTNGVFDILHCGHVDLLTRAKSFADVLVVGLNTDASTRRLKGPGRPINRQADRVALVAALRQVDCICLFSEDTPLALIRALQPDLLIKGAEYPLQEIVGADLVKSWGGSVRRVAMRRGYSSTRLIRRARKPSARRCAPLG